MRLSLLLLLLCAFPLDASAAPTAAAVTSRALAQDPVPDKRPEVLELVDKLDAHASKKGSEDIDAVAVIDKLNQEFPNSGPKDRAAIVKALSKCFEQRRLGKEGEPPDNRLYIAAAAALGQMGPDSTKTLAGWIGHKDHRKDLALQRRLLLSLGHTKDKAAVKPLLENLENKEPQLIGAAAEALAEFADADQETRKQAFEAMLKVLMSAYAPTVADTTDTIARERYDIVAAPIITTLQRLSKHEERDPAEWQRWWNKNKKADWDSAEK
jgi:hypothetical protein